VTDLSRELVSVIIPTHNRAHLVGRAITSVLSQTHASVEVVVVDDGSTDDTAEVLGRLTDARIKTLQLTPNQGHCRARNTGIASANGRYVAFCDSDDEWLPTKLEEQLAVFAADDSVAVVYTGLWVDRDERRILHVADIEGRVFDRLLGPIGRQITTSGIVVDRALAGDQLHFDEELPCAVERELLIRLSRTHRVGRVAKPLYVRYANHGPQISARRCYPVAWRAILKKYELDYARLPRTAAAINFQIALTLHRSGDHRGAREALREAARLDAGNKGYRTLGAWAAPSALTARVGLDAYLVAGRLRRRMARAS